MKGLSEKRLSDYMAEQIADEILAGRIEGGSQLKQEELAAVKCKETDGKKEAERAICEQITGALNGAEKYTKTFAKAVNSEIDRWVLLLAEQVKEERRKNR